MGCSLPAIVQHTFCMHAVVLPGVELISRGILGDGYRITEVIIIAGSHGINILADWYVNICMQLW